MSKNMNHTTQSVIIVSMLAALTIAGISVVASMQAHALTANEDDDTNTASRTGGLCATDQLDDIISNPITANPCKPPETEDGQSDK